MMYSTRAIFLNNDARGADKDSFPDCYRNSMQTDFVVLCCSTAFNRTRMIKADMVFRPSSIAVWKYVFVFCGSCADKER